VTIRKLAAAIILLLGRTTIRHGKRNGVEYEIVDFNADEEFPNYIPAALKGFQCDKMTNGS